MILLVDVMEQEHFLASGSGESLSSSGSHTLSEGEETTAVLLDIKVSADGDDCHNSDCESVNEAEDDRNTEDDKETVEDEDCDEDEKVNTALGSVIWDMRGGHVHYTDLKLWHVCKNPFFHQAKPLFLQLSNEL